MEWNQKTWNILGLSCLELFDSQTKSGFILKLRYERCSNGCLKLC